MAFHDFQGGAYGSRGLTMNSPHGGPDLSAYEEDKKRAVFFRDLPSGTGKTYRRVRLDAAPLKGSEREAASLVREAIALREKWVYHREVPEWHSLPDLHPDDKANKHPSGYIVINPKDPLPKSSRHTFSWKDGVVRVDHPTRAVGEDVNDGGDALSFETFVQGFNRIHAIASNPIVRSFCWKRNTMLGDRFRMYLALNEDEEKLGQKVYPHRDFYNVYKIDTHVHHTALANEKELLTFIKHKLKKHPDDKVLRNREDPEGPPLTLREVFDSLGLKGHELSLDLLDMHADRSVRHRFDRFNLKYNPIGESRLREVFLKTDNYNGGAYLGELTRKILHRHRELKYQHAEYRVSIYGKKADEWKKLGKWFREQEIVCNEVRWLIQVPRLYASYKREGLVECYQEMLSNMFVPMFEATINPNAHPDIAHLLRQTVGIDSVDDESQPPSRMQLCECPLPQEWTLADDPPYAYQQYFLQANMRVLNKLREERGMNTLSFRPHSGEAGPMDHLVSSFLLANGINHGLQLKEHPVLQYLYYTTQIGIAMSPLSNAALFCEYYKNPCMDYFCRGLNVSLSTDDPLQFAYSQEPLMEEYSVFAGVFRCSNVDMCELARNSVLQSGFEAESKQRWIGSRYYLCDAAGNDTGRTNVPDMRIKYRYDTLLEELKVVYEDQVPTTMRTLATWTERQAAASPSSSTDMPYTNLRESSDDEMPSDAGVTEVGDGGGGVAVEIREEQRVRHEASADDAGSLAT